VSINQFSQYYNAIKELCNSGRELIIYGAGSNGVQVFQYLKEQGCKILAFCDSSSEKQGGQLFNLPVISPEQAIASGAVIIVASHAYPQIIAHLQTLGVNDWCNLSLIGLAKQPFIADIDAKLHWLNQRLEDDESRQVFMNLLNFLIKHEPASIDVSAYPQYRHPKAIPKGHIRLIDGGACVGEIFDTFADYPYEQLQILCLEPEQGNIKMLQERISRMNREELVEIVPYGLWSKSATLRFASQDSSGANYNCSIRDTGDVVINTKAIDELCREYSFLPNLIKMDIEGAEIEALKGAATTIKDHKPMLAVCLYHHLDDLWRIPELIQSFRPDYKMSLGHHTTNWFETVLYCY